MSAVFEIRTMGERGVLIELADNVAVHTVAAAARQRFGEQLIEIVPGHHTVLLVGSAESVVPDVSELADVATASSAGSPLDGGAPPDTGAISIPVDYRGEDLAAVAQTLGVAPDRVIELHSTARYTVAFMGFAPGFPYLVGLAPELELPRLELPRQAVPAGSVAVAARYCGIYPRSSPGGWNLLGRTELTLFDPSADSPALLAPGDQVRFEPI